MWTPRRITLIGSTADFYTLPATSLYKEANIIGDKMERITLNEWIQKHLHDSSFNEEECRAGVEWIYDLSGFKKPEVVIAGSPMAAQEKANELFGRKPSEYVYQPYLFPCIDDLPLHVSAQTTSDKLKGLIEAGVYDMITLSTVCIVVKKPIEVHLLNGKLHNLDGPAIRWADGSELHFVDGRVVDLSFP